MSEAALEATRRLADRVFDGEVVFFIGSGFSIDSERNTAGRLVGRLLAGLLAMGSVLASKPAKCGSEASNLLDGLGRVFGLSGAELGNVAQQPARHMTDANLERLAREYYSFNDWAVSALGILAGELIDHPERSQLAPRIEQLGTLLLRLVQDHAPLGPLAWEALEQIQSPMARGKALFLDVMGFADAAVMAGDPRHPDAGRVLDSYAGRLRPRHHALARIAREGLAASLVTTNYDLLIEGAYRLAGFSERSERRLAAGDTAARFSRIAGAEHFFARGSGYRTAMLLKIHGCAGEYRTVRAERLATLRQLHDHGEPCAGPDSWNAYLPALVFTYREIQTWRSDAWSRDLLRTLLRTHTIALCGYSGADPVMHATFREVYEEKGLAVPKRPPTDQAAANASVFYFGLARKREFHSFEILRAATLAAGLTPEKLVEHPNHIEFELAAGFPSLDDHFRFLLHCMLRTLQRRVLQTRIRRTAGRLLGRPCRDKELELLNAQFDKLCDEERKEVSKACRAESQEKLPWELKAAWQRRVFDRVVGWTWHFLPGLLRELSLADVETERPGNGAALRRQRTANYYHPASEHPEWTGWSVVVELALRELVHSVRGSDADLSAEDSPHAALSFTATGSEWRRSALCLRHADLEQPSGAVVLTGAFARVHYWDFEGKDVPWPVQSKSHCPSAEELWNWALGKALPSTEQACCYLGIVNGTT